MLLVSRMSKGKLFQTVTEECEKIDAAQAGNYAVSAVNTNGGRVRTTFYCVAENFKVFTITTSNLFKNIKNKMSLS